MCKLNFHLHLAHMYLHFVTGILYDLHFYHLELIRYSWVNECKVKIEVSIQTKQQKENIDNLCYLPLRMRY